MIQEDKPAAIFVLNADVCCSWPLEELLASHLTHPGALGSLLVKRVSAAKALSVGEVVADEITGELLHYKERPETLISNLVNAGVYVFNPSHLFHEIGSCLDRKANESSSPRFATSTLDSDPRMSASGMAPFAEFVRLDGDVISPNAGKKKLYTLETDAFWEQVKTPGSTLKASELYLSHFAKTCPSLLQAEGKKEGSPEIKGTVFMHPSARIDATAKLGPNVSIASGVRVGAGARLMNCVLLLGASVGDNAVVSHAIVGGGSKVGKWGRVQGSGDADAQFGVSILGEDVSVGEEACVVQCIVLPHKEIRASVANQIIL